MEFHFGLGKYFSPLERDHRTVFRKAIEAGFGVHYCLDYPGASRFFRRNTSKGDRSRIEVIARVPAFDAAVTESEVDLTLRQLRIERIEVLQLWGGDEVFAMHAPDSPLRATLERLQRAGKIGSWLPQLYHDQTVRARQQAIAVRSFAFYGSPLALHIDEQLLQTPLRDGVCMSCFGGVERGNKPTFRSPSAAALWDRLVAQRGWNGFCLAYVESLGFVGRAVGPPAAPGTWTRSSSTSRTPRRWHPPRPPRSSASRSTAARRDHVAPTRRRSDGARTTRGCGRRRPRPGCWPSRCSASIRC